MAKETVTRLIDDLDGGEAHETVTFTLDGQSYEIDLSSRNAARLRNALAPYLDSAKRLAGRGGSPGIRAARGRPRVGAGGDREQNQAIRAWAQRKGLEIAARGRIKQEVVELYHREAGR